jgi:hypothetical protein
MKLFAGKAGLEVTPSSGTPSLAQGFRIKLWSAPDA